MHSFLEDIQGNLSGLSSAGKKYYEYMTIINGIDTDANVSHVAGSILSGTGFKVAGIGNTEGLLSDYSYNPTIEAIFAEELSKSNPVPVSTVLFQTVAGKQTQYTSVSGLEGADLFKIKSLRDLEQQTTIPISSRLQGEPLKNIVAAVLEKAEGRISQKSYEGFKKPSLNQTVVALPLA